MPPIRIVERTFSFEATLNTDARSLTLVFRTDDEVPLSTVERRIISNAALRRVSEVRVLSENPAQSLEFTIDDVRNKTEALALARGIILDITPRFMLRDLVWNPLESTLILSSSDVVEEGEAS